MTSTVAQRTTMVDSQVRTQDVTDPALVEALRHVARESVVPREKRPLAYADSEIEYSPGRWMMRPRDIAKLLQALAPDAGERALAISAPYAAEVLATLGLAVVQQDAAAPPSGAFDLVVCEGAVSEVPSAWLAAVAPGGRLGVVERRGPIGRAMLYARSAAGEIGWRPLFDSTPPYLAGFEPKPAFVF